VGEGEGRRWAGAAMAKPASSRGARGGRGARAPAARRRARPAAPAAAPRRPSVSAPRPAGPLPRPRRTLRLLSIARAMRREARGRSAAAPERVRRGLKWPHWGPLSRAPRRGARGCRAARLSRRLLTTPRRAPARARISAARCARAGLRLERRAALRRGAQIRRSQLAPSAGWAAWGRVVGAWNVWGVCALWVPRGAAGHRMARRAGGRRAGRGGRGGPPPPLPRRPRPSPRAPPRHPPRQCPVNGCALAYRKPSGRSGWVTHLHCTSIAVRGAGSH
jgi:hypothetical protein